MKSGPRFELRPQVACAINTCATRLAYQEMVLKRTGILHPSHHLECRCLLDLVAARAMSLGLLEIVPTPSVQTQDSFIWYLTSEASADQEDPWRLCAALSRGCRSLSFEFPFCFPEDIEDSTWGRIPELSRSDLVSLQALRLAVLDALLTGTGPSLRRAIGFEISARILSRLAVSGPIGGLGHSPAVLTGLNALELFEDVRCISTLLGSAERWLELPYAG